jgi:hypothetical protein
MMMWYRAPTGHVGPSNNPTIFYLGDDPQTLYSETVWVGFNGVGSEEIFLWIESGIRARWTGGYPEEKEKIFNHICLVREGALHRLYVNAVVVGEATYDVSAFPAPTHQYLGTDTIAADWAPHEGAYFREWDKALTLEQVEAERDSFDPVTLDHLVSDVPFQADFNDSGVRGFDVPAGTLTLTGLKLDGVEVPAVKLALVGQAPQIDTYITPPVGSASLVGELPVMVIGP